MTRRGRRGSRDACVTASRISLRTTEKIKFQSAASVNACYDQRSAIVHGRWEDSKEFHDVHMYDTECIVRTVVRHMASKPGMLGAFLSPKRNDFLEAWVKSKAFTPPPFPN